MTLDEITAKAQDNLLDVMSIVKTLKDEVIKLNQTNLELQTKIDELTIDEVVVVDE